MIATNNNNNMNQDETRTIFVRLPSGATTSTEITKTTNVNSLKAQICSNTKTAFNSLNLIFNGKELTGSSCTSTLNNNSPVTAVVAVQGGGTVIDPITAALARKFRLDKKICRKCYCVLNKKTNVCRKRKCGHWGDLRARKALQDKGAK